MNLSRAMLAPFRALYSIGLKSRELLPTPRCNAVGPTDTMARIGQVYVINLDRRPDRWMKMINELRLVRDSTGERLVKRAVRFPAVDARTLVSLPPEVNTTYTLADQLFVEPQPYVLPNRFELDRPIEMSRPEIAVALSHIGVWRLINSGEHAYALVLEDDTWFRPGFSRRLERVWRQFKLGGGEPGQFDLLYLSYQEVKHGAPKKLISSDLFCPIRGLWWLSGYVLSRTGARRLLELLPCRGPIDLWLNHKFSALEVRAIRHPIIEQRRDTESTNSYSILPSLTKIGVLKCETRSLFQMRPTERPVFAFGCDGSHLSSLAMALSMLGYRCCSDVDALPEPELEKLIAGETDLVFDAYVNVGSLWSHARTLRTRYPHAKFIVAKCEGSSTHKCRLDWPDGLGGDDVAVWCANATNKWKTICEHLRCPPPVASFPETAEIGQRRVLNVRVSPGPKQVKKGPKRDRSPWVIEPRADWQGIRLAAPHITAPASARSRVRLNDSFVDLDTKRWLLRDDTFGGNLALFRPSNVEIRAGIGAILTLRREPLGVRQFSAGALSSRMQFSFGTFEATLQATNVPGVVTGFFLQRDSPRQEIDLEIVGKRSDRLLTNVFYNPGDHGARFDYGYRGAPCSVDLGFDASESPHRFKISWGPHEIGWFVDDELIHKRVNWDPTPIPQLPMTLHVNIWPPHSRELAGRLVSRRLPATVVLRSIALEAGLPGS